MDWNRMKQNTIASPGVTAGGESCARGAPDEARVGCLYSEAVPVARRGFLLSNGVGKAKSSRLLDGRTYDEYPKRVLRPVPDRADCIAWEAEFGKSLQASGLAEG